MALLRLDISVIGISNGFVWSTSPFLDVFSYDQAFLLFLLLFLF